MPHISVIPLDLRLLLRSALRLGSALHDLLRRWIRSTVWMDLRHVSTVASNNMEETNQLPVDIHEFAIVDTLSWPKVGCESVPVSITLWTRMSTQDLHPAVLPPFLRVQPSCRLLNDNLVDPRSNFGNTLLECPNLLLSPDILRRRLELFLPSALYCIHAHEMLLRWPERFLDCCFVH
jgi:hypothetical protein